MAAQRIPFLSKLMQLFVRPACVPNEMQRAIDLIAAIDAGGIPLNPAVVNGIARSLGLEVSRKALPEETIERIRAAVERAAR